MPAKCLVVYSYASTSGDAGDTEVLLGVVPDEKALVGVSREIRARFGKRPFGAEHDVPWYRTSPAAGRVYVVVNCDTCRAVGRAVFEDISAARAFAEQERAYGDEVILVPMMMGVMDYSRFGVGSRCS